MKRKNKFLILAVSILFISVFLSGGIPIFSNNFIFSNVNNPSLSAPPIITSPEDTTYVHGMEGYYPATYGFENDEYGANPLQWHITENAGSIQVINEIGGHNKVVELYKNYVTNHLMIENDVNDVAVGKIEFWWRVSSRIKRTHFEMHENSIRQIHIRLYSTGKLQVRDGNTYIDLFSYSENVWYHFSVEFDCSSDWHVSVRDEEGNYKGGDNGIGYSFQGSPTVLDKVRFANGKYMYNWRSYVDAVSYTWDPNYNSGDNYCEGLLLDFNDHDYSTMSYQLDTNPLVDILGDCVIPFPNSGNHGITVWGNGEQSSPRYFSIENQISITTPNEINYKRAMDGYFLGTYGFENDDHWGHPQDWVVEELAGGGNPPPCDVRIENMLDANFDGVPDDYPAHKKVLRLADASNENWLSLAKVWQQFDSSQSSGTIEFWFRTDWADHKTYMLIHQEPFTDYQIWLEVDNKKLQYRNSGDTGYINTEYSIENNLWYHFRISFECDNGNYDGLSPDCFNVYVNGESVINDAPFTGGGVDGLDKLIFQTHGVDWWYSSFFDAVGYSWDPEYKVGDNLLQGLLLDFEPDDYISIYYQLDNLGVFPILGDTVIPFYLDEHTIRVIGKDASGNHYYSDLLQFSCFLSPLIGSEDRFFPQENNAKLGYIITSVQAYDIPTIEFSLMNTKDPSKIVDIKVCVDNSEIFVKYNQLLVKDVIYPFVIEANVLGSPLSHQIVLELSDGEDIKLESLVINELYYYESQLYKGDRYTPMQYLKYEDYDEATIEISSGIPFDNDDLAQAGSNVFPLDPALVVTVNPDMEDVFGLEWPLTSDQYYIQAYSLKWRVLKPNGFYLTSSELAQNDIYVGVTEDAIEEDPYPELEYIIAELILVGLKLVLPEYCDLLIELGLIYANHGINPIPSRIDKTELEEENAYEITWNAGFETANGPVYYGEHPFPQFNEASMELDIDLKVPEGQFGYYQVEFIGTLEIYNLHISSNLATETHSREPVATLSSSHYINFEYASSYP